jgi:PAS domain S-box-containing protein
MPMKKSDLELRIKELELELSNMKSDHAAAKSTDRHASAECDFKFSETILQENEKHYKIMFESSPIAINITHGSNINYANPSYLKIFGFSTLDDLKNIAPLDLFTPEWRPKIQENIQRRAKDLSVPETYEAECFRKDGSKFPILMYLTRTMFSDGMATIAFIIDMTERKKSDEKLRLSEEKFSGLFHSSPNAILVTELKSGKILEVNRSFERLSGFSSTELLGHPVLEFNMYSPAERQRFVSMLQEKGNVHEIEYVLKNKAGRELVVLSSATIIDIEGEPYTLTTLKDITESKRDKEEFRKSEEKYKHIVENAPMGIFQRNLEGQFNYCNITLAKQFECNSIDEFLQYYNEIPKRWANLDKHADFKELLIKNGKVLGFENELKLINGKTKWFSLYAYLNATSSELNGFSLDITERKLAEKALQKSNQLHKSTFASLRDAVFIIDLKTTAIADCNHAAIEIFGYSREEMLGKTTEFIHVNKDTLGEFRKQLYTAVAEKGFLFLSDFIMRRKDGTVFPSEHTVVQLLDEQGVQFGWVSVVRDITERKRIELDLIKAKEQAEESNRLKSAFLVNMSHEIRTPMNGILGFAELLKEPNLKSDDRQDYFQTMQISAARMLSTINSIVDIAKIESGLTTIDIRETNINEKCEFIYKFFKPETEKKGLKFIFKIDLPPKEAIIKTDNEKVYGVLTNIIKNAIKFTYDGSIEFGYKKKGEYLEFYVQDTGIGIPHNQKEIIFERFRQGSESNTRGYEGSGLGLSIAKSYVEILGGEIWVESDESKGSTFYFTLPYNPVSEEEIKIESTISAEHKEVKLKNLKILIVEDDEISYSLLSKTLQRISKEILHAISGVESVEICHNNPDLDLVLMDIRMPGMDGLEAIHQIRQFNTDVIIIAQTAYGFSGDREKAIEAGCDDYISKPIDKTKLYELIKKNVNKSRINTNKLYQL